MIDAGVKGIVRQRPGDPPELIRLGDKSHICRPNKTATFVRLIFRERLKKLDRELANLKEKSSQLKAQWQNEKAAINAVGVINGQVEQAKTDLENARPFLFE